MFIAINLIASVDAFSGLTDGFYCGTFGFFDN
jgi:hypothetical protein